MSETHRTPGAWRVQPVDPADRVPLSRAIPLVVVETMGVTVLFAVYYVLRLRSSDAAPYLIPPVVSFVLVFVTAHAPGSRPLRVVAGYAIAATCGLLIGCLPLHSFAAAILAGAVTLLLMHLWGAFHAPAVTTALVAGLLHHSLSDALVTLPMLIGLAILVVVLVWVAHHLLGDRTYPQRWW